MARGSTEPGRVDVEGLSVAATLYRFVEDEAVPGSGVRSKRVWQTLSGLVHQMGSRNQSLVSHRDKLQEEIDSWHLRHGRAVGDPKEYRRFLERIGYLEAPEEVQPVVTQDVDDEIASIAAPQLIVPATNPRYVLNAANARWGSLYDATYGTDALGKSPPDGPYDPDRGAQVVAWVRDFLDVVCPLNEGSHRYSHRYAVAHGQLEVLLEDGRAATPRDPDVLVGYRGTPECPDAVLLRHHDLHVELVVDPRHPVGRHDLAGVSDVVIEAAVTTIVDGEDSVAVVDAAEKVVVYRTWLGLMRRDLAATFTKHGDSISRRLSGPREYVGTDGRRFALPGTALLMTRNVGLHMMTDTVLDRHGRPVPEGFVDAVVTTLIALHDRELPLAQRNSRHGSVYIVKPKLHGSSEAAFADAQFAFVERGLGLPNNTVKLGLMDEERRTSLNLAQCLNRISGRVVFINTGFLDRTGDEIHTSIEAGAMVPKGEMRHQPWFSAYEDRNVDVGLAALMRGRGQIGKGMWAFPDRMRAMLEEKIAHPLAGADCAWVPSPTAATLHATHYHHVDVNGRQVALAGRQPAPIEELLKVPVAKTAAEIGIVREELETNLQGILGYVVRWVDHGVGCSKVLDVNDIGLMEDRATCRISSQHVTNWLHHGIIDAEVVEDAMRRMALRVDQQNADDPQYEPMAPSFCGLAYSAALALVLEGRAQPSGYTEPILYRFRRLRKARMREEHTWKS